MKFLIFLTSYLSYFLIKQLIIFLQYFFLFIEFPVHHSMNLYLNLKYQYQIYYPLLLNIIAQYLILFMIYVFTIELSPIRIFVFIY